MTKIKNFRLWKAGGKHITTGKHQQLHGIGTNGLSGQNNPEGKANQQGIWWTCAKCDSKNSPTYKKCGKCGYKPLFGTGVIR